MDVETKVDHDGFILYRFYSKPMKNNMVIQNGTGLSQDIVFSSLRQEVVRRLINTCNRVTDTERMELLEEFIQLMSNSGHKFTFMKSVLMQGITKFEFMLRRSKLAVEDKLHMPLHREKEFNREERILVKYVSMMLWYTGEKLGDPFRQLWRKNIKYKSDWANKKSYKFKSSDCGKRAKMENTTTLFVPQSKNSTLFKMIRQKEKVMSNLCGWSVKVL